MTRMPEGSPVTADPRLTPVLDGTVRQLDRRARLDFMFDRAVAVVVLTIVGTIAALVFVGPVPVPIVIVIGVALIGVEATIAHLRWRRFTWQAQPEALALQHGIVVRRASYVPYHRIQQIDLRQRPVQRVLGLSTLILRTAAATTDAELPGVATADADALRQELLHRAGLDDAV